jgi:hypothetical protein
MFRLFLGTDQPSTTEWEFHRKRIVQLYFQHHLGEVADQMVWDFGFKATLVFVDRT